MKIVILILFLLSSPLWAHEWYPPDCCSGHDCAPMPDSRVTRNPQGDYVVDKKYTFTRTEVRKSLSGRYHGCYPQGDKGEAPRCFFAPSEDF